LTFLLKAI